jgi:ABC-2 type transport system ATP-binding protein
MTSAVETVDLTRRFGRTEAVNGLTLGVPTGSIFPLIGPNGAGKSTTLKLLMTRTEVNSGSRGASLVSRGDESRAACRR